MSAAQITTGRINNTALPNESSQNRADGTFEGKLQAEIERMFDFAKLEFDFNFPTTPIEDKTPYTEEPLNNNQAQVNVNDKKPEKQIENEQYENSNTDTLKEVLTKNIPISHLPSPISPFSLSAMNMTNQPMVSRVDLQNLINEIVKQAKLVRSSQKTKLSLSLSQKELGNLFLDLAVKNGQVLIEIGANPEAKKLLEDKVSELILALQHANIEIQNIKITEVKKDVRYNEPG
ncbi:flagellar hook-length control protein FliK [Candidatus Margulisiibacteriota bacterium]